MTRRPRIIVNALPLDPRGGGVSTYIRNLLASLVPLLDADLLAAVRPTGRVELPEGITHDRRIGRANTLTLAGQLLKLLLHTLEVADLVKLVMPVRATACRRDPGKDEA